MANLVYMRLGRLPPFSFDSRALLRLKLFLSEEKYNPTYFYNKQFIYLYVTCFYYQVKIQEPYICILTYFNRIVSNYLKQQQYTSRKILLQTQCL